MERVAPDVYRVDAGLFDISGMLAVYILDAAELTVVDTGAADTPPRIVAALDELGYSRADVEHIVVSHVHLDHAGGAGALARECPNATVHVHERGRPYLTDRDRLTALKESVDRAMGTEDAYGVPELVPAERARAVADGDRIDLGDRELLCVDAPGHAPHHFAAFDTATGALFSIDSAGMWLDGRLYPTTPPPAFDPEANAATARRLVELGPSINLYGHFGAGGDDPVGELERFPGLLREWVDAVDRLRSAHGDDADAIVADLDARWRSPTVRRDVRGVLHWLAD